MDPETARLLAYMRGALFGLALRGLNPALFGRLEPDEREAKKVLGGDPWGRSVRAGWTEARTIKRES